MRRSWPQSPPAYLDLATHIQAQSLGKQGNGILQLSARLWRGGSSRHLPLLRPCWSSDYLKPHGRGFSHGCSTPR